MTFPGLSIECRSTRHSPLSCFAKGNPAWPPLALFEAMLLVIWYNLSDVKLAEFTIIATKLSLLPTS